MATNEIQPVATPVATAPNPVLTSVTPEAVYSPTNIQQIDVPSTKKVMDMKLSSLEKKLAKANSIQELNQIGIMNQPKAMGVLTGEAAYRSKLDTARINAFNSLYNTRLAEEQRKEAERQQFIQTYGADPKSRPKGMSKKEFAKAIQGGKFSDLLTEDFKQKQLQTLAAQKSLAGSGGGSGISTATNPNNFYIEASNLKNQGVSWGEIANTLGQKYDLTPGSDYSNQLDAIMTGQPMKTPAQQQAELDKQISTEKAQQTAQKALGIVQQLESSSSLGAAVGTISSKLPTFRGGTADFERNYNSLKSLLTLENMGLMKGVLSDSDIKILQQAATALDLGMSESGFKKELQNVRTILETRLGQASQGQLPMSDEEAYVEYLKSIK